MRFAIRIDTEDVTIRNRRTNRQRSSQGFKVTLRLTVDLTVARRSFSTAPSAATATTPAASATFAFVTMHRRFVAVLRLERLLGRFLFVFVFIFGLGLRSGALRRYADLHCCIEAFASATTSAATAATALALAGALAFTLARSQFFFADDDRIGLRLAFDFRNERTVLRFFLFADRRNPDRSARLLERRCFFRKFA